MTHDPDRHLRRSAEKAMSVRQNSRLARRYAARTGGRIVNASTADPLLKHFSPENPQWARQFA